MAKTLKALIDEYGANGVILVDRGNGSAGPAWVEWDNETEKKYGDVEMCPASPDDMVYEQETDSTYSRIAPTLAQMGRLVVHDYSTDGMYASAWLADNKHPGYSYRLIF